MKTLLKSAVLVIAFLASFAQCVKGQNVIVTNSLPESLPIGSLQRMYDWAVTNRNCTLSVQLVYTNISGSPTNRGLVAITDGSKFDSYEAFNYAAMTNGMFLYNLLKSTMCPTTTVRYRVFLFYVALNADGLKIDSDIGLPSEITTNSFLAVTPSFVQAAISVAGLQMFSVHVDLSPDTIYNFTWTPNIGVVNRLFEPPFPNELTTANLVILNSWYSVGEFRARFKVTAFGITKEYTQYGDALTPAVLTISPCRLDIQMAKGSDTALETSTDLVNWTSVTNFVWSLRIDNVSVTINPVLPLQFYRAQSN